MGIRGRLALSHFFLVLAVVLLIGLVIVGRVRAFIIKAATATLEQQAEQVAGVIDRGSVAPGGRAGGLGGAALARLVSRLAAADFLIVDTDGRVVSSSERLARFSGSVFESGAVSRALAEDKTVSATFRDPLGRLSVIAVAPVTARGGGAAIGAVALVRPVTEVTQSTRRLFWLLVEASLIGLLLSLVVSLLLARGLTRPLLALEGAADKVARGDFSQRVPVQTEDELGRVAASFNAMAERLGELERERRDLYASVSHELRTPVTSIKGFAQALEDNVGGPDERRRHVAIILEEASRLERLVNDLFQLARLEAGQVKFEWRALDLASLSAGVAGKYEPQARAAGVTLTADTSGAGPGLPVRGDPDRLTQVLSNLLDNALRFTPDGGRVAVRCGREGKRATVAVGDSGPGIPPEDLERVFDRFYTVDRSRARNKGGTGLGLAIAKEIIQAHGGQIWAGRAPEGGALLTFALPLAEA